MTAFLQVAWDLRYLLALIVGLCVGAVITLSVEAARERRVRDALLLASLRDLPPADTDAPIHDQLAAEWLAAELDDPKAIERWLSA